jgi:hypothetical protein
MNFIKRRNLEFIEKFSLMVAQQQYILTVKAEGNVVMLGMEKATFNLYNPFLPLLLKRNYKNRIQPWIRKWR